MKATRNDEHNKLIADATVRLHDTGLPQWPAYTSEILAFGIVAGSILPNDPSPAWSFIPVSPSREIEGCSEMVEKIIRDEFEGLMASAA